MLSLLDKHGHLFGHLVSSYRGLTQNSLFLLMPVNQVINLA